MHMVAETKTENWIIYFLLCVLIKPEINNLNLISINILQILLFTLFYSYYKQKLIQSKQIMFVNITKTLYLIILTPCYADN